MHISDHLLSNEVALATGVATAAVLAGSVVRAARHDAGTSPSPLRFGSVAGLIFALQMLNFPVNPGTSGHFLGGALAVALLGWPGGLLAMGVVLLIQAAIFGDGGLSAFGANFLCMAIIGGAFGLLIPRSGTPLPRAVQGFCAAALSVLVAAAACSGLLVLSGVGPASTIFHSMIVAHLPVAVAEAAATLALVWAVVKSDSRETPGRSRGDRVLALAALVCAGLVSPFASELPDGLEASMDQVGHHASAPPIFPGLLPDYTLPAAGGGLLSVALAGVIGTVIVFLAAACLGRLRLPASTVR